MNFKLGVRFMFSTRHIAWCFPLLLQACASTPVDEVAMPVEVPASWSAVAANTAADRQLDRDWWLAFNSPPLMALLDEAEANAPDLRIAVERIRQASIAVKLARAAELPGVSASAGTSSRGSRADGAQTVTADSSSLGVSLSYEVDLFGRLDAQSRARQAEYTASRHDWQSVRLSMMTAVAGTYFQWLQTDARIRLALDQQQVAQRILDITQSRLRHGVATPIDVTQQQAVVLSQEIALGDLRFQQQQLASALALLLGKVPQGYLPEPYEFSKLFVPEVPASLPGTALSRRPDLASAEEALRAASANIDAARAAMFPSLSLTGSYGLSSDVLIGLSNPVQSVGLGLSLMQILFDGGQRDLQLESQNSQRRVLVETYAIAIRNALKEVEDSLGNVELTARQTMLQQTQVDLAQRSLRLAELRYKEGAGDFLTVLESQRSLFSAQDQQSLSQFGRLQASLDLFKSLGGDWLDLPS